MVQGRGASHLVRSLLSFLFLYKLFVPNLVVFSMVDFGCFQDGRFWLILGWLIFNVFGMGSFSLFSGWLILVACRIVDFGCFQNG